MIFLYEELASCNLEVDPELVEDALIYFQGDIYVQGYSSPKGQIGLCFIEGQPGVPNRVLSEEEMQKEVKDKNNRRISLVFQEAKSVDALIKMLTEAKKHLPKEQDGT